MRKQEFIVGPGAESPDAAAAYIHACAEQRRKMRVTVCQYRKDRSTDQNAALFGVAYKALSEFTGYEAHELHEMMLKAYFGVRTNTAFGVTIERPARTTTTDHNGEESLLNTVEFNDLYSFIQRKGAEIGCLVPDPDPSLRRIR